LYILLSSSGVYASYTAEVRDISNRNYFPAVKEAIDNADNSIHMAMYILNLKEDVSSPVDDLVKSLIRAKERGVEVKVILDKNINFFTGELEERNKEAYKYLRENGIDVFYDDIYIYTHNKTLVIDEEIVIVGSTNWSNTALTQSNESAVLVHSPEIAKSIAGNLEEIKLYQTKLARPVNWEKALSVSKDFLLSKDHAGRMITSADERAFDLYLLLLYHARQDNYIDFDFDKYAFYLGIDGEMTAEAYRRQIIKTLRKLKRRYRLVELKFHHGRNAQVRLVDMQDRKKEYQYSRDNYFLIPAEYFEYGWSRNLSFRSKFCFLINCYMFRKTGSRFWTFSQKGLSDKFNLALYTVSKGMNELRRLNIVDIEYSPVIDGYKRRDPATYELLGLYCPEEHKEALLRLKEKYGKDKFDRAIDFAEVVFRENDTDALEEIINLIDEYGEPRINRAYEILSRKAVGNPKRTLRYGVGIIKGLRDDEVK
ncbi:MAG: phospholipase D-like domain-containing protein, partial [Elusimicrobiota bacterium]